MYQKSLSAKNEDLTPMVFDPYGVLLSNFKFQAVNGYEFIFSN